MRFKAAAQSVVADDLAGFGDADVIGIQRVGETDVALYPFAFPANLDDGESAKSGCRE